ncbi:receptor-like protein kinase, partial [Trifolium pratense]
GYLVPKNGTVNFMVAEMGWDPHVWKDPMECKPERFLKDKTFDITGNKEIMMMPFGAGRRICPGYNLPLLHLEYFVANLVWNFDWKVPEGGHVDLSEKQDLTMIMKNPLQVLICRFCRKSRLRVCLPPPAILLSHWLEPMYDLDKLKVKRLLPSKKIPPPQQPPPPSICFHSPHLTLLLVTLLAITGALATPYYKDFVVNATLMTQGLTVQVGPANADGGNADAILNGIEVLKISNTVNSLDGEFGVDGRRVGGSNRGTVAAVGFAMMFGAFVGLGAMVIKWHKRPQDWQKRNSFSSWLLPLHAGDTSFMSSKNSMGKSNIFSSSMGLGRIFSFAEIQEATKNFDSKNIIGVGGFGNVYLGVIDEGTQVAVKRGNPQSEQ